VKEEENVSNEPILTTPRFDTGSNWYTFLSFILSVPGLIAGLIFKKKNHIRNYKACKKGAIAGLVTKFAIVALFGLALLSAVL
jgi:oligopeptide transport system ATP-binding protein